MSNSLHDRAVHLATREQFREFFESEGWTVSQGTSLAIKRTKLKLSIMFYFDGVLAIGRDWIPCICIPEYDVETFGAALTAANNLARTEIFGGWENE